MTKYTNTQKTPTSSTFVQVSPTMAGSEVTFNAASVQPKVGSVAVPMVRGSVRLASKANYTTCENDCGVTINESVRIEFNVIDKADGNLSAIRSECVRLMDLAIAEYYLAQGLVPPVSADFSAQIEP